MVFSDTILITVMNTVERLNLKSCSIKTVQCSMFEEILLEVCRHKVPGYIEAANRHVLHTETIKKPL